MLGKPIDVLEQFPVRKTKPQKTAFLTAVTAYLQGQNYTPRVETGSRSVRNLVIGDPEKAKYLVTAHYDTCSSIGLPNVITPCNPVAFILYQLFVVGLLILAAVFVGFIVSLFTDNRLLYFWCGYIAYFAIFFLLIKGPANPRNANDNTSGVVTLLEIAKALPADQRNQVCFVLFDLEESHMVGSGCYRKAHKNATDHQIVLNLDCVGDGDTILLFPTKKLKQNPEKMEILRKLCGQYGTKSICLREKGFAMFPSDQAKFPYGVGIGAFRQAKVIGLYCGRIHTRRDTVLEYNNINILRDAIIPMIGSADK